jgi:serine/threonine-protein kinase
MAEKIIGRYEVRAEIGRGGMAVVYLGYDPTFRRQVAIKVLPHQWLENNLLRARFEREARAIAALEHPAIVPVHDFGEQDGQPFLVMRYMPGGSLSQRIQRGALPLGEASDIVRQLAPALDAVHARGIVHRDLKPANILFDAYGNPALSDFGIAQFSEATLDLTGDAVIGTPSYMSPEQVRSDASIDGRSDLYALGVILYEMLTGQQPYRAATPMSVAMKHLTDPVPQIRALRPQFPAELDAILAKALAKDREQRYARAADLAADLLALPELPSLPLDATLPEEAPLGEDRITAGEIQSTDAGLADAASLGENGAQAAVPAPRQTAGFQEAPGPARPASSRKIWLLPLGAGGALLVLGLCVVLALGLVAYRSGWLGGLSAPPLGAANTPAPAPIGTETTAASSSTTAPAQTAPAEAAAPTLAQLPAETAASAVLFYDDFSQPAHGWPQGEAAGASYSNASGAYRAASQQPDTLHWASPEGSYADASLSVDARLTAGDGESYFGLLCRIQDADNFYYLVVRPDGYFTIGIYQDGQFNTLLPGGWTYSSAVAGIEDVYRLRADCRGDSLSMYLGEALLGQAQNSAFSSGRVGLALAAIGNEAQLEIDFDEFTVRAPR